MSWLPDLLRLDATCPSATGPQSKRPRATANTPQDHSQSTPGLQSKLGASHTKSSNYINLFTNKQHTPACLIYSDDERLCCDCLSTGGLLHSTGGNKLHADGCIGFGQRQNSFRHGPKTPPSNDPSSSRHQKDSCSPGIGKIPHQPDEGPNAHIHCQPASQTTNQMLSKS